MAENQIDMAQGPKKMNSNKWSRTRRIEFIDFRLNVDGRINRSDLVDFFGISVPQASLDLSYYRALVKSSKPARQNLVYDMHQKVYLRTDDFIPIYPDQCGSDVIFNDLILSARNELASSKNFFGFTPDVGLATMQPPKRIIDDKVLVNILDAIRGHLAVHIVYKSLDSEKDEDYLIAPHSFAFDGIRWHARAYCYDRHMFRDYVLSRIKTADRPRIQAPNDRFPDPIGNGFREVGTGNKDDEAWNQLVTIRLKANPELPERTRRAIELDYNLQKDGVFEYKVKKALLLYTCNSLHLGKDFVSLPPHQKQLVCENESEIQAMLDEITSNR